MHRFLFADDMSADQTWQLLAWCVDKGASDFTVDRLWLQGKAAPFPDRFEAEMAPFRLDAQVRPRMSAAKRDELNRSTDLWLLSGSSIGVLRAYFPDGLFTYPTSEWDEGCLEGPTFYRDQQIMLGVVSHEREGILTLTAAEHDAVAALGIASRDQPERL
ncbi:MAG: hypothetical protein ABI625_09425 [bacterium]